MVVAAVGMHSYFGKLKLGILDVQDETPCNINYNQLLVELGGLDNLPF